MKALVFSIDDLYVMPFQVLFHSIHQTGSLVDNPELFILHENSLSEISIASLRTFIGNYGQRCTFINASGVVPADLPLDDGDHVSKATFYRLFVADILPSNISSALYLDSDTVVARDISTLLRMDMTLPIAAADHLSPYDQLRLWGWSGGGYFQAGVLLINLDFWRSNRCSKTFVEIMQTQRHRIQWWDQDVLNIAFANNWQRLDVLFNVCNGVIRATPEDMLRENARLIHFDGSDKPWQTGVCRPFQDLWLDAYRSAFGTSYIHASPPEPQLTAGHRLLRTIRRCCGFPVEKTG